MCRLKEAYNEKEFIGYKYVLKKDGKYYSPAMGIEYISGERVTIPERQYALDCNFTNQILDSNQCWFSEQMIGRTAAFRDLDSARRLMGYSGVPGYQSLIVVVKLEEDLMDGCYYTGCIPDIVAGRKITILKELSTKELNKNYAVCC